MTRKVNDNKNRHRSKTVGFRVSPEEWEQFEKAVRLSGLSKQDYLISRLYDREIVVQPSPRVYKALRDELAQVHKRLIALSEQKEPPSGELLETIRLITKTLNGCKEETHEP